MERDPFHWFILIYICICLLCVFINIHISNFLFIYVCALNEIYIYAYSYRENTLTTCIFIIYIFGLFLRKSFSLVRLLLICCFAHSIICFLVILYFGSVSYLLSSVISITASVILSIDSR